MNETTPPEQTLSITRLIDATPAEVYRVWVERMPEWWAPKPWTTEIVEMDLRPGGRSAMIMRGPDGEAPFMEGVILEAVPAKSIVFTDAFRKGWVPQTAFMSAFFTFADEDGKTRYTAGARHWTAEARQQHEAMGFIEGWGKVADQLIALVEEEKLQRA